MHPVTVFIERFRAAVSVFIGPCCPALLESYSRKCAYCCIIGQIKWWWWSDLSNLRKLVKSVVVDGKLFHKLTDSIATKSYFFGQQGSAAKRHFGMFSRFAQLTRVPNSQTYTDDATCDIRNKGPYIRTVYMRYINPRFTYLLTVWLVVQWQIGST